MVSHRLVEVDRRAAWCVETGKPHGTNEGYAQRVFGVLELLIQARIRLVHSFAMRFDIQP
ncbi:hypothetical protein D3C72_2467770 [compost metagenome]